jgi:hypothetical protein
MIVLKQSKSISIVCNIFTLNTDACMKSTIRIAKCMYNNVLLEFLIRIRGLIWKLCVHTYVCMYICLHCSMQETKEQELPTHNLHITKFETAYIWSTVQSSVFIFQTKAKNSDQRSFTFSKRSQ